MRATVTCQHCQTVLGVPKTGMPSDGLTCIWCSATVYATPPTPAPPQTIQKAFENPTDLPKTSPSAAQKASPKANSRQWADDEDDDGQPYAIPDSENQTKKCLNCHKEIDKSAVLCIHCGHDERSRSKNQRTYSPIDCVWEQGWPFARRISIFGGLAGINFVMLIVSFSTLDEVAAPLVAAFLVTTTMAFVLGTYPRLRVRRNKKGQVDMTTTWRLCFIPLPTNKVEWKKHEGVIYGVYDGVGISDWVIFFTLLNMCIVPALLWWWFAIKVDKFYCALTINSGSPETYLYRGLREDQAKEITQTITDATGLKLYTPI